MYKKLLLLVLALMFMVFSNLRVCCRLTVDGEAVPGSFSPVSADIAVTVAERAAEEILPGFADMPDTERHYMLSLSRPDGSRAELADALLRSTPGVTVNSAVYVGGVRLGSVPDSGVSNRPEQLHPQHHAHMGGERLSQPRRGVQDAV